MLLRCLRLVLLVALSGEFVSAQQSRKIEITKEIALQTPAHWHIAPKRFKNAVEITTPEITPALPAPVARILVTTEERRSHEEALNRLAQIAAGYDAVPSFLEIGGWPALQRRVLAPLPRILDPQTGEKSESKNSEQLAWRVTTAVATGSKLIRAEAYFVPGVDSSLLAESEAIGRSFVFSSRGEASIVQRDIQHLQLAWLSLRKPQPPRNPSTAPPDTKLPEGRAGKTVGLTSPPDPLLGPGSEVSIAASADGQNVVVATNRFSFFSTDSGTTFSPAAITPPPGGLCCDPSVASAKSGNFYLSLVAFPSASAASGAGCAASMFTSTDGGRTFTFTSNPAFCSLAGTGPGGLCLTDQPQIAADRVNFPGADEIYEAWRNITPQSIAGIGLPSTCTGLIGYFWNSETPTLTCSSGTGASWSPSIAIGSGDFPRLTVGPDGFLYVVLRDGQNVMLYKYTSCGSGLSLVPGFPVLVDTLANCSTAPCTLNDPVCPIPGLDRCDGPQLSNATVAVDETNSAHVYVAYAEDTAATNAPNSGAPVSSGNDDIFVQQSTNGGLTWGGIPKTTVNTLVIGRRFMPWVTTAGGGAAFVSWYDRRAATATANDLTDFFIGAVPGTSGITFAERKVSGTSDPQCASGWTGSGSDSDNDSTSCSSQPQVAGHCYSWRGVDFTPAAGPICDITTHAPCTGFSFCHHFGAGAPKYGDYNGIASARNLVFTAWASNVVAPTGINTFASTVVLPLPPTISSVTPNQTQCGAASTTVTIGGTNLLGAQRVSLLSPSPPFTDFSDLSFTVNSNTQITANIPNSVDLGIYEIVVFNSAGNSRPSFNSGNPDLFTVRRAVTGISPTSGPVQGGTEVTVSGHCIGDPIFFGSSTALEISGCASGSAQCVVISPPAAGVGVVDVVSGADAMRSAPTPADQFTYNPPVITSVNPPSGPVTGGTTVNIRGSGFPSSTIYGIVPANSQVSFGNSAAYIESCIDILCKVVTPPAAQPGPVDIIVTAFGGSSTPSPPADVFTYDGNPVLAQFQLPDPFFQTAGFVALNGKAPAGGAVITLTSSDPTAVVLGPLLGPGPNVTIPAGSGSALINVTFLPTSKTEPVTLTATYGNTSLTQVVHVNEWPPISIVIDASALAKGVSTTATVTINPIAPAAGAAISVSSSDPSAVTFPTTPVTITAGSYEATFTITGNYSGPRMEVTIFASYGGTSASATLFVPTAPAVAGCTPHACPKGYYWNPDKCSCERPRVPF